MEGIYPIALLLWAQGGYFALTGIWPLLHYRSFEKVTGRKTDVWLVKILGALIIVVGCLLLFAAWRNEVNGYVVMAGTGSAVVLLLADVIYVARKVIAPVYLADAAVELVLLGLWILYLYNML